MAQPATQTEQTNVSPNHSSPTELPVIELARELGNCAPRKGSFPIPARLNRLEQFLQSAYDYFTEATKTQVAVSNVSEWLLDNFYVLEQASREIKNDLPTDFYSRLPQTPDGWTRIYILAAGITRRGAIRLDLDQIRTFVQAFQTQTPTQVGELWGLPLMLRLASLEALGEGLSSITKLKWEVSELPDTWNRILLRAEPAEMDSDTRVVNSILNLRLFATLDWKSSVAKS